MWNVSYILAIMCDGLYRMQFLHAMPKVTLGHTSPSIPTGLLSKPLMIIRHL
jgi:hypothetical protein